MKINLSPYPISRKESSLEKIREYLSDKNPKRIHFATSHKNAIKEPNKNNKGKIILPFEDTLEHIISIETGITGRFLFPSKFGGVWRTFRTLEEYKKTKNFIEKYNNVVFLRDTLELSIALSMNYIDDERTEIGSLAYLSKFEKNKDAEDCLTALTKNWLNQLPYYNKADALCAMPCTDKTNPSLPRRIVDQIDAYENVSETVIWKNKTQSLKDISSVEAKLEALQEYELKITSDLRGKNVILLDDLYMSGLTMQYVAMKLKENGAERVFGINIVKSRSNTAL